jgi:hypothetical protein
MATVQELMFSMGALQYAQFASTNEDTVGFIHPELVRMYPRYKRIRDCLNGQDAIKEVGDFYLPRPNPTDTSPENRARYEAYLKRAVFYPVLKQTSQGLIGQCFFYNPIVEIPDSLKGLKENTDGVSDLFQFTRKAHGTNVNFGRGGLLTDFQTNTPNNKSESDSSNPTITLYEPEMITNWKERIVNGKLVLSKVVLKEFYDTEENDFSLDIQCRYRVLKLDKNNLYIQEIWEANDNGDYKIARTFTPTAGGNRLTKIPFGFLGAESNSARICTPQMDSIATVNLSHFINSADYEESCYQNGQGTLVVSGLTDKWYKDVLKSKIRLGALGAIPLNQGADAKMLQINPNSMPIEAMRHKEDQMISLGAKLIQPSAIVKTATESTMEKSSENSILTCTSKNTSSGITDRLKDAYYFKTGKNKGEEYDKINFEILTESAIANMTPNEMMQVVESWIKGAITKREMRTQFRKAGIAFEDDSLIKDPVIEVQQPQGGMKGTGTVNPASGRDFKGNENN